MEREFSAYELKTMSPKEFRSIVRRGEWTKVTEGACSGYVQANLVVVPEDYAYEFLLFCQRNPSPCPVIDVTNTGDPAPRLMAPGADLRTDLPGYRIYQSGKLVDEPTDIIKYWRDDLVAFLIGCSLSFDWLLRDANIQSRLIGVYTSNIQCVPVGRFHGPMVVTCRLVENGYSAVRTIQISSRFPKVHGAPVHIGDPAMMGIKNLYKPDMYTVSDVTQQKASEIPMYWGCGMTPQAVVLASRLPFMITHGLGYMFVTDRLVDELAAF